MPVFPSGTLPNPGVPVPPYGAESAYVMGNDWDADESSRAELFAQQILLRGQQQLARIRALAGNQAAYLGLLARTSAARRTAPTHLDTFR